MKIVIISLALLAALLLFPGGHRPQSAIRPGGPVAVETAVTANFLIL